MNRRTMMSAFGVGLVPLTGCIGQEVLSGSDNYADIELNNETSEELTVTLGIVTNGEQELKETFTLASEDTDDSIPGKTYREVVGTETATVEVAAENGPEGTHEFSDTETDARTLVVDISTSQIEFVVGVA